MPGTKFKAHEFHYSRSLEPGEDYQVSKANGRTWKEGFSSAPCMPGTPTCIFTLMWEAMIHFVKQMREHI